MSQAVDEQGFVSVDSSPNPAGSAAAPTSSSSEPSVAGQVVNLFQRSSHPKAALFHVAFKTAALVIYFLYALLSLSQVQLFVVCIVLMAFDFWTVKNVSGRLMVGLRWWNESAEDGTSTWRYESIEDQSQVSGIDYSLFWYPMYLAGLLWGWLAFWALLHLDLKSVLLCSVNVVLVWSNVYGFWNCSAYARNQLQTAVMSGVQQGALAAFTSKWFSGSSAAKSPDLV